MTESEELLEARDFIIREVQKKSTDRVDAISWGQGPWDPAAGIHRLVVFRGGEKSVLTFSEYELLNQYGSKEWEKQLRGHVGDILMEF